MNKEILDAIKERGLLLEKEIFDFLENLEDIKFAKDFLDNVERYSGQKIITRQSISKNFEYVQKAFDNFPGSNTENIFVKLGLSLEIRKEKEIAKEIKIWEAKTKQEESSLKYSIFYADTKADKKLEVNDFTAHFRGRYQQLQRILMQRPDLNNLVSIGKISAQRQNISIIGMVKEKRTTKNRNLILTVEDLTGECRAVFKEERQDIFKKAREAQLDDVIAIKASGNSDMIFAHDIYFPDAFLNEKTRFEEEYCIAFLSDIHCGSDKHLGRSFERFLDWLNSGDETAQKIKYLFFVGDNVDGVGIFPGQENVLSLKSMEEQYELLASYLKRISSKITMFMCPGQHDATRVAEPQPLINRKYAPSLYQINNLVLVTNPAFIRLHEGGNEFKVLMYHGASIHNFINEISELREAKAHKTPAKAVCHMLKRRHMAPTHSSAVYIPFEKDPLVISEIPDVLCTGEVHRLDIDNYNGILVITGSCWQGRTAFEEKVGNVPDPAKVPVLNLKTRELKIFDFGEHDEIKYAE